MQENDILTSGILALQAVNRAWTHTDIFGNDLSHICPFRFNKLVSKLVSVHKWHILARYGVFRRLALEQNLPFLNEHLTVALQKSCFGESVFVDGHKLHLVAGACQ